MKVSLTDLFMIQWFNGEFVDDCLARFRNARNHCYAPVPEAEVVKVAINGLDYDVRKKLVNQQFLDLSQLVDKVRQVEQLRREKEWIRRKNSIRKEKVAFVNYVESDEEESEPKFNKVHMAELKSGPPYVCTSLRPIKGKEKVNGSKSYPFDITKVE